VGWIRDRRVLYPLGATYLVILAVLVTGPWGWELNRFTVRLYVLFRSDVPIAPAGALPEHYGFVLNVLLFVPLGALLAVVTGQPWWRIMFAACAGSVAIELAQWSWLEREGGWLDVLANTAGAAMGAVTLAWRGRAARGPRPSSPHRS
jgi:glycopeptide antibiotics resistance protein